MLNEKMALLSPKEQERLLAQRTFSQIKCPICGTYCYTGYQIDDITWATCICGCIFHCEPRTIKPKDMAKEIEDIKEIKDYPNRVELFTRLYMPLIEESTYGRQALTIGNNIIGWTEKLKERGWISDNIDAKEFIGKDFGLHKYYLITMIATLQEIDNPVMMLKKAHSLLFPSGMLLITTGDTEAIFLLRHPNEFSRWDKDKFRILFSQRQLVKTLNNIGFDVVLNKRNMDNRLFETNEVHIIAIKTKEEAQGIMIIDTKKEEKIDGEKN